MIKTAAEIAARAPIDACGIQREDHCIALTDLHAYPHATYLLDEKWTYVDPKRHPIARVADAFAQQNFQGFCFHEPSDLPLQRVDKGLAWWTFCRKCGDWTAPHNISKPTPSRKVTL